MGPGAVRKIRWGVSGNWRAQWPNDANFMGTNEPHPVDFEVFSLLFSTFSDKAKSKIGKLQETLTIFPLPNGGNHMIHDPV